MDKDLLREYIRNLLIEDAMTQMTDDILRDLKRDEGTITNSLIQLMDKAQLNYKLLQHENPESSKHITVHLGGMAYDLRRAVQRWNKIKKIL